MREASGADLGALITQLGVGGIFAILIIREVLNFLKGREGGSSRSDDEAVSLVRDIKLRVDELYKWHDVRDEDQVPVWYVRKSLEREIGKLRGAVGKLEQAAIKQAETIEKLVEVADE